MINFINNYWLILKLSLLFLVVASMILPEALNYHLKSFLRRMCLLLLALYLLLGNEIESWIAGQNIKDIFENGPIKKKQLFCYKNTCKKTGPNTVTQELIITTDSDESESQK